jgi:outer membrane protein insertion porin family
MPIPVLPESYGLSASVWADAAYIAGVGGAGLAIDPLSTDNPLKASVGASIIWHSPFGPLRGDFAYVLSKATKDRTQLFQLTLQTLL